MSAIDDYLKNLNKKKEDEDFIDSYISRAKESGRKTPVRQYTNQSTSEVDSYLNSVKQNRAYRDSLPEKDRDAYTRVQMSNGVYSSPYLKSGSEGKEKLKYNNPDWNALSEEERRHWLDIAEGRLEEEYNQSEWDKLNEEQKRYWIDKAEGKTKSKYQSEAYRNMSPEDQQMYIMYAKQHMNDSNNAGESDNWKLKYAAQILNDNSDISSVYDLGTSADYKTTETYDKANEQRWMWNSLPQDVRTNLVNGKKTNETTEYLEQNYSPEEVAMFRKYADAIKHGDIMEENRAEEEALIMGSPLYATVGAPAKQILGSVLLDPIASYFTMKNIKENQGAYGVVDPYATAVQRQAAAGQYIGQSINEGLSERKLAQFAYNTSVSTTESALRLAIARGIGGGISSIFHSISAEAATGIAMNALMAPAVVNQTATELIEKGVPASQALDAAVMHGLFECLFETISFDKLDFFDAKPIVADAKTFAKNLIKAGFVEGSEEVATDIANELYDYLTMYDYSDFKAFKDTWDASRGVESTDKEAWGEYKKEFALKLAQSFAGGAVSGLSMGALTNADGMRRANYYRSLGENIDDATANRMRPVVDSVAAVNPNVRGLMENASVDETTARGAMSAVIEQMEKPYIKSIERAKNDNKLNTVMENMNTNLNGLISESAFNAYNAKKIEFGKEGADYQTFLTNRDKGNQTTFSDLAYGNGDNVISKEYRQAQSELENILHNPNADMTSAERVLSAERAVEAMQKSQEKAEDVIALYARQGKTLDDPELRKYVGIVGTENAARAYSMAKLANEAEQNPVQLKKGHVFQATAEEVIKRGLLAPEVARHIKPAAYSKVENTPQFQVLSALANMTGTNVGLFESDRSGEIQNGAWIAGKNTILVDANAGVSGMRSAIGEVISHELTHWIRTNNEAGYDRLYMFLRKDMGEKAFDSLVNDKINNSKELAKKYNRPDLELDTNTAAEEVVAEACQRMLASSETFMRYAAADMEGAKSLLSRLKDFIKKLREYFRGSLHNQATRMVEDFEGLAREWEKALNEAIANVSQTAAEGIIENKPSVAENIVGTELVTEESTKSSQRLNNELMERAKKEFAKVGRDLGISYQDFYRAIALCNTIANRMLDPNDLAYYLPEDNPGKVEVGNASYGRSMENAMECIRSIVNNDFTDMVSEAVGRPLTVEEQLVASQILQIVNSRPECNYCYVATDRRAYRASFGTYFKQYEDVYNKVAKNREAFSKDLNGAEKRMEEVKVDGGEKNLGNGVVAKAYAEFLNGRKNTPDMRKRFLGWVNSAVKGEMPISRRDLTSARVRDKAREDATKKWFINDAEKYAQSATWAKKVSRVIKVGGKNYVAKYVSYNGSILKWKQTLIDKLNEEFGLRMYSFSDYVPAFILENMQMIIDASLRGLKVLAYTKDCGFAEAFAETGAGINISLFGTLDKKAYKDENLNALREAYKVNKNDATRKAYLNALNQYVVRDGIGGKDGMMGANWDRASALRKTYKNVGTVFVATNDDLVEWALANPEIDVVIPYHLVRTGEEVAAFFDYNNYKAQQEDKKTKDWTSANLKSIPPTVHGNDLATYKQALKDNNLTPRFEDFIDNPNYMKLVNETRLSYKEMKPVQPIFDQSIIEREVGRIKDEGQYGLMPGFKTKAEQDAFIENQNLVGQAVDAIGEWNESGKKPIDDTRYSFRGESSTMSKADQKNLAVAREMDEQNYDSEKIRLATGWFKGMDGKWRNEVDDSGAKFKVNFISNSMFGTNEVRDAFTDAYEQARRDADSKLQALNAMARKGVTGNMQEYKDANAAWVEASKTADELDRVRLRADHGYVYLSDILDHPKLFKAYPQLKNMRVSWFQTDNGLRGVNYGGVNGISVAINRESAEDVMSTLMHEVQHEIQNIEGFSKGASPSYWAEVETPETKTIADLNRKMEKLTEELSAIELGEYEWYGHNAFELASMYAFLNKALNNASNPKRAEQAREDIPEVIAAAEKYNLMDKLNEYAKLSEEISKAKEDAKANKGEPFDLYQRTAGEIESRDVQARLNMSAKERKATRPDIDREDVVFAKYSPREMNSRLTEDDIPEYLRAGKRNRGRKSDQNARGEMVILTSDDQIRDYIDSAIHGESDTGIVAYGRVGNKLEKDVMEYSNGRISVVGDFLELSADDLKHAYKEHHNAKQKGDIDLSDEDFLNIPDYFDDYDELVYAIQYSSGKTNLCVAKNIGNGKMLIIETVSNRRGSVWFKNAIGVSNEKYEKEYKNVYKRDHSNFRGSNSSNISRSDDMVSKDNISQYEIGVNRMDDVSINESNDEQKETLTGNDILYSRRVDDKKTLDFLNNQDYITTYRSFQVINGGLYSPMNQGREGYESVLGEWEESTEIKDFDEAVRNKVLVPKKNGGYDYNLKAGKNTTSGKNRTTKAAYNPYLHSSNSVLNDQFAAAYDRPNLVVVECHVPKSEEARPYWAKNATDPVGWKEWKSGKASTELAKSGGEARGVFLSRWMKPVRILPYSEVAQMYKDALEGTDITIAWNVVPPGLRHELEKIGVPIDYSYKNGSVTFENVFPDEAYKANGTRYSIRDGAAVFTEERVDRLLRQYGAKNTPNYAQAYAAYISPDDFLMLTTNNVENIEKESRELNEQELRDNPQEIFLKIEEKNGKMVVYGHEGRHRMVALRNQGVSEVAISVIDLATKYTKEITDSMTLSHQIFNEQNEEDFDADIEQKATITDLVPISYENEDILKRRFTGEHQVMYSYRDLANSESEILINALKNDAALVDEFGARPSIEAYAREYNRLKEMENQQIEITKQLRKKDTSPSEREVLLKKMVRLDRAILNKTTELTEMRNQRVIRDLLISEWDKRDTLVAAGRAEERYLTRKALEEKYGKELSALKEKSNRQKQEIRDRHTINERKARIIKKTKQLMDMCLHPTEKKKVPTVLINPVVELLDAIDYWTPAEGRRVTKKSESLRERFVNFREAINEYQEQINEGTEQIEYMFDPEFLETVDELAKSVKGINNVNDMNAEEITALDQTLTQLYHLISRGNKMITASHYQTVNEYTDKTRQAMEKRKTLSEKTSAKGSWLSRLNAGMSDTYAFGEYAGEGTREIVDMLSKAFEDKEFHVKEAIEFTQEVLKPYKKELKKWSQDEHEFTLSTTDKDGNPNKVKLTVGQMMELYLLNKREQARGHIYGGGIRVENRKGKFTESVKITESDVAEIMDYLKSVPGAMEVADKLQQYGATTITGWGNQASNLMYGISKFTDENYWQIRSDSSALKDNENTEKALNASMYRLQNMGRTKAVKKGANNAIYIGDVFDTWSKTIDEMTSYASILPATTDAMRWWNSRVELDGENTVRVKKLLESKLGTDMTRVFTDTIKALNGGIMGTDSLESLVKKLTGKAKAAAVAGNLRVVLQQPTAYTRAAAVIEPKYLLKALTMKPNAKEAQEHSAIAWHKAQGFYSNGLAPSLRKMVIGDASIGENLTEKSLWLAGKADDITWGALWNASKLKVEAENKALKVGSDAYWNEVNKVFSNIINQTQVVDTPLTKSTWMRGNGLGVYFTAFMAEPTKTYSMVMERLDRVLQNPTSKDAWKAFAGVGAVFAVNAMVNAMAQALADAARDDDKEKDYWEKYIEQYNKDVKDNINPITYIPVVKDIWSLSQGYSNSNLSMQAAQNTVYAVNELKKIANGTSKKTLFGQAETVAKAISGWTGIPVGNVMRTLNSIGNVAGVDIFRRKKYTNSELGRNVVLSMNEGDTSAADKYMAELLENCKGDTNKANNYVITYLADHDNEIDAWAERYMEDATTINDAIDAMSDKYSAEIVTKAIRKSVNNDADEDDKIKTSTLAESQYTSDDINRMLENGKITEAQDIIDEVNAKYKEMGSKTTAKNAVTAYWKPKYLAASGAERDKILKMLYKLKNNGQQMYSSKDIAKWK